MSPGSAQESGVALPGPDHAEAERTHAQEVVAALHREAPLPFAARRVAERSDQQDAWHACSACVSPAASSSAATYSPQAAAEDVQDEAKAADVQSSASQSYVDVSSSNMSGHAYEGNPRSGDGPTTCPEGDVRTSTVGKAGRAADVAAKSAVNNPTLRVSKGLKSKKSCHTACRPRWKLRDVVRNLRRMMPSRRRHFSTEASRRSVNAVAREATCAGVANSSKDAMPLMPLTSWTEPFWEMRPPSEGPDSGSEDGHTALADMYGNDEHANGSVAGGGTSGHPLRKSLDSHSLMRSCLPDVILPGTGLSCRDCVKPNCPRADFLNHELPKSAGTKSPKACPGGMTRTASAPELEVFGIERNFEFGGTGWVRTAAEDQPAETVFFPMPPEHAGWRVYHSGHHAKRKRLRRIQNQGLPLRSRSWSPNANSRKWVAPASVGGALAERLVPAAAPGEQVVFKL